eukprot:5807789-Pyramimonas_sp.AAC.1
MKTPQTTRSALWRPTETMSRDLLVKSLKLLRVLCKGQKVELRALRSYISRQVVNATKAQNKFVNKVAGTAKSLATKQAKTKQQAKANKKVTTAPKVTTA